MCLSAKIILTKKNFHLLRSVSNSRPSRPRHGPRSPPLKPAGGGHIRASGHPPPSGHSASHKSSASRQIASHHSSRAIRPPTSPPPHPGRSGAESDDKSLGKLPSIKHRMDDKVLYQTEKSHRNAFERVSAPPRHDIDDAAMIDGGGKHGGRSGAGARSRLDVPEDPRLKTRPPEPPEPAPTSKKSKDKSTEKVSK